MIWLFKMEAYAGDNHPGGAKPGTHLMTVTHADLSMARLEMSAFEERMKRGAVGKVDVFDLRTHGQLSQNGVCIAERWRGMEASAR